MYSSEPSQSSRRTHLTVCVRLRRKRSIADHRGFVAVFHPCNSLTKQELTESHRGSSRFRRGFGSVADRDDSAMITSYQ